MQEIRAIIWKEWAETRLFLWIAWSLLIGLPVIGDVQSRVMYQRSYGITVWPWVIMMGPILAIVIGVAQTCRDLQPKLEDFWQSRPMGSVRLFTVKFFVGVTVLLAACLVPLLVQFFAGRYSTSKVFATSDKRDTTATLWLIFFGLAIYSIAFASGCVLHRTAHAAAAASLGALLLYCLPVIFPPAQVLEAERFFERLGDWQNTEFVFQSWQIKFALGMLVIAVVMVSIGIAAVRWQWHVESEQPLIYSAACGSFLLVIISASYQLGTNLPVLQTMSLKEINSTWWQIREIVMDGSNGTLYTSKPEWVGGQYRQSINASATSLTLGEPMIDRSYLPPGPADSPFFVQVPGNPHAGYAVDEEADDKPIRTYSLTLCEARWNEDSLPLMPPIPLWSVPREQHARAYLLHWNNRLYVIGEHTICFDISDPLHPKQISDEPNAWSQPLVDVDNPVLTLPSIDGVPAMRRLRFVMDTMYGWYCGALFDGETWCRGREKGGDSKESAVEVLELLHLTKLTDTAATFQLIASHSPTLVQRMFGSSQISSVYRQGDLLYTADGWTHIDVYSLAATNPLQLIGHYVQPGMGHVQPLPDGRAIAYGSTNVDGAKLLLLGQPPKHKR